MPYQTLPDTNNSARAPLKAPKPRLKTGEVHRGFLPLHTIHYTNVTFFPLTFGIHLDTIILMDGKPKELIIYEAATGECPFESWLEKLDFMIVARIRARLKRVTSGNMGDADSVGDGVSELRFFFGSGFRVYFGNDGTKIVVLLCGGDKSSQTSDIRKAKLYWQDYRRRKNVKK